jgi:hypothetical protein
VFRQPLGALIFFIAATAEANRTPFDLTEADSEIVAGFATEYSGMRFGFLFFAEYVNVFIVSAITVVLFLGWNAPFPVPHISWVDPGSLAVAAARDHDRARDRHAPARGTVLPVPSKTRWWVALILAPSCSTTPAAQSLWAYINFD